MGKPSDQSTGVTPMCQAPAQDPMRPHGQARGQQMAYKCETPLLFPTLRSAHNGQHGV